VQRLCSDKYKNILEQEFDKESDKKFWKQWDLARMEHKEIISKLTLTFVRKVTGLYNDHIINIMSTKYPTMDKLTKALGGSKRARLLKRILEERRTEAQLTKDQLTKLSTPEEDLLYLLYINLPTHKA
jgi:hypothetical protein